MTFPLTILPLRVELNLNGTWTDITSKVRAADPGGITIKRGLPDESSLLQPATMNLSLNNRDGRFSPRNPSGIYYGLIGRNTPIRCSITGTGALAVVQETGVNVGTAYVQTPDVAALDIVGDIDVRFDADFTSWRDVSNLVTKWTQTGNQRSYAMYVSATGVLRWVWSTTGADTITVSSTVPLPAAQGRYGVRAVHDVNNGAAGNTVTFYYSTTGISGTWVQLGDPVVSAGVTSIFSSSSPAHILQGPDAFNGSVIHGRVYAAQIYNGIAGTLVANPDFTVQTNGATSFADSTGKTWTVNASSGSIGIVDYDPQFVGEVTSWPVSWDQSGNDVWSPIECADVVRRLGQGAQPFPSAIRAFINGESSIKAYWPMEDGSSATSFASGLSNGNPMTFTGNPSLATDSTSFVASDPLPQYNNARFTGNIVPYGPFSSGVIQTRFFLSVPSGGAVNGGSIIRVYCSGSATVWDLTYGTGGALTMVVRDSTDTVISTPVSGVAFGLNGNPCYVSIHLVQNGSNIDWALNTCQPGSPPTVGGVSGTVNSQTIQRATKVIMNNNGLLADVTVGHVSVASVITTLTSNYVLMLNAYTGETAITRMKRLSTAQGVPFRAMGAPGGVVTLGPQEQDTFLNVMQSAGNTDGGILFSPKDALGLAYRSVAALSAQPAKVTLDHALSQMATLQPTEDDQSLRNDVTVTQTNGSSARAVDTTSPLSTQQPPLGAGVYDTSIAVNVATVDQLAAQANWRLRVGTINEARYPTIDVNLASYEIVAAATLTPALAAMDIGDRLDLINPPSWLPPDVISQTVRGYTQSLSQYVRYMSYNCSPAAPFNTVAVYGPGTVQASRYSSDGSTVNGAHNSTTTSLSVATPSGPLWITTATVPGDFPFDIRVSGERMTVTAIVGTTSPQTFTVTRSVNGVVKSQINSTAVELFTPAYYSL